MSTPSITESPHKPDNKKKRPNFRPSQRKKAGTPIAPTVPAAAAYSETTELRDLNAAIQEAGEIFLLEAADEAEGTTGTIAVESASQKVETNEPLTTKAKRGRKRKKTGVPVGTSRHIPAPTENKDSIPVAVTKEKQTNVPADSSGQPTLSSFCSKFRSKRKKTEKKAQPTTLPVENEVVDVAASGPAVQVVNGEIVLQESSIVVTGRPSSKPDEELPVVEEEAQLAVVGASYNSFVNRRAPQHWSVQETQLFYDALRQVGTDFGTMEAFFDKKRTRKQLKRKYQVELTKNPLLIEKALDPAAKKSIDMSVFEVEEPVVPEPSQPKAQKKTAAAASPARSKASHKETTKARKTTQKSKARTSRKDKQAPSVAAKAPAGPPSKKAAPSPSPATMKEAEPKIPHKDKPPSKEKAAPVAVVVAPIDIGAPPVVVAAKKRPKSLARKARSKK